MDKVKIILGFSIPKDHPFPILSWIIKLVDKTPYSHVYIRWKSKSMEVDVAYHAAGSIVHFLGKKEFDKKIQPIEEYELEINKECYRKLVKKCMEKAGTDYGKKQALGLGLQKIFKLKENPFSDGEKSDVCSETAMEIMSDIRPDIKSNISRDEIWPSDVNKIAKENFKRIL